MGNSFFRGSREREKKNKNKVENGKRETWISTSTRKMIYRDWNRRDGGEEEGRKGLAACTRHTAPRFAFFQFDSRARQP